MLIQTVSIHNFVEEKIILMQIERISGIIDCKAIEINIGIQLRKCILDPELPFIRFVVLLLHFDCEISENKMWNWVHWFLYKKVWAESLPNTKQAISYSVSRKGVVSSLYIKIRCGGFGIFPPRIHRVHPPGITTLADKTQADSGIYIFPGMHDHPPSEKSLSGRKRRGGGCISLRHRKTISLQAGVAAPCSTVRFPEILCNHEGRKRGKWRHSAYRNSLLSLHRQCLMWFRENLLNRNVY